MRRRALLGLVCLAPLACLSQPPAPRRRIGFLGAGGASGYAYRVDGLRAGLRDLGYVEGRNITIEYRWADGNAGSLPALAQELVRLKVEVLVTHAQAGTRAARQATATIPIVVTDIADAVDSGVVASLARPDGNITGSTFQAAQLMGKRLELLKEAMPSGTRVGLLLNPNNPISGRIFRETAAAGNSMNLELRQFEPREPADFEPVFLAMKRSGVDALLIQDDPLFTPNRELLARLARDHRLPSAGYNEFPAAGGLFGYGLNFVELYRRAAYFVDRILLGAKPGDLPMEQPARFELIVNLRTASALGVSIPRSVLARADRVIE